MVFRNSPIVIRLNSGIFWRLDKARSSKRNVILNLIFVRLFSAYILTIWKSELFLFIRKPLKSEQSAFLRIWLITSALRTRNWFLVAKFKNRYWASLLWYIWMEKPTMFSPSRNLRRIVILLSSGSNIWFSKHRSSSFSPVRRSRIVNFIRDTTFIVLTVGSFFVF